MTLDTVGKVDGAIEALTALRDSFAEMPGGVYTAADVVWVTDQSIRTMGLVRQYLEATDVR